MVDLERTAALGELAGYNETATEKAVARIVDGERTELADKRVEQKRGWSSDCHDPARAVVVGLNSDAVRACRETLDSERNTAGGKGIAGHTGTARARTLAVHSVRASRG